MPRPTKYVREKGRKILLIRCFYCGQKFEYSFDYVHLINRAYCEACKKRHFENRGKVVFRQEHLEYLRYLEEIKNQVRQKHRRRQKEIDDIILHIEGGRLFKGKINLGEIKDEDEKFICVQKSFMDSICFYRKQYIKKL